ncbi:MAG: hypothetical protein J0I79_19755 [Mesorhizobium sp.]|uniref:hypothetical protein n=1 Tax=Mesorhizobium sp. TaxID=1871066 RepID=UPI001ACCD84D|nr:hypothetical protein [Mesorhizobium sp.]MBN9220186.1 hypothetical protein [Mesorhizobium sp.]
MTSDFSAAGIHLERACHYLQGTDHTSVEARQALDLLIEAVAVAECSRPVADVVPFRKVLLLRREPLTNHL